MTNRVSASERRALARYLRAIRAFPRLTREDERRLIGRIAQGDAEASRRLVESNLGFVVKVATEYRGLGLPFEDLLHEGNLGLIEAAGRFDPSKETKFITYAVWWIRKTILRAIGERSSVVRVPSHRRKQLRELRKAESALLARLGRPPTREELARHLSVSIAHVDLVRSVELGHTSLDRTGDEDSATPLLDYLADERDSVEERLLGEEARLLVARAFRRLSLREQSVLDWRLALSGRSSLTLQQIGQRLGLSRERVRQIECAARRRLGRLLAASLRGLSRARPRPTVLRRGRRGHG